MNCSEYNFGYPTEIFVDKWNSTPITFEIKFSFEQCFALELIRIPKLKINSNKSITRNPIVLDYSNYYKM